jgi:hypothetical protein
MRYGGVGSGIANSNNHHEQPKNKVDKQEKMKELLKEFEKKKNQMIRETIK